MDRDFSISARHLVEVLYKEMLQREPDALGLQGHLRELLRHGDPANTLRTFLTSPEFRAIVARRISAAPEFPHDLSPANPIELALSEQQMSALWRHVETLWSTLGIEDPYWSVMTSDSFRLSKMSSDSALGAFYETGLPEIERLKCWLARHGVTLSGSGICAEYGCGVGRLTYWLSKLFAEVIGLDISQPHLDAADAWLTRHGRRNARFRKVSGRTDLSALSDVDFFYTVIVLQHNPPPIMHQILKSALGGLKSGGHAFFQIPTYFLGYRFEFAKYIATPPPENKVEMHCLPQSAIFRLARDHDCDVLEVQPDHMTGSPHVFTSNTFLLRKH